MATRMVSQLDDSEATVPMSRPPTSSRGSVPPASQSQATRTPGFFARLPSFDALPAMTRALCALAAIWVGSALFVSAFAFYADTRAEIVMALIGGWLLAAGTAYVIAGTPSRQDGFA